jgi:hypothetical protein
MPIRRTGNLEVPVIDDSFVHECYWVAKIGIRSLVNDPLPAKIC